MTAETDAAARYFDALRYWTEASPACPGVWAGLFCRIPGPDARALPSAVAGVNAHINFDLPFALVTTFDHLGSDPVDGSDQHHDYLQVNDIFAEEIPGLRRGYLDRWQLLIDTMNGDLDDWWQGEMVEYTRNVAWRNAQKIWAIRHDMGALDKERRRLDNTATGLWTLDAPALQMRRQEYGVKDACRKWLADTARCDGIAHGAVRPRVAQMMIGRHHNASFAAGADDAGGIGEGQRQRLLAKHVLARTCRCNRLVAVQFIGGRDVDGIDRPIRKQRIERVVALGNPVLGRIGASALRTGTHHRIYGAPGRPDCTNHPFLRDGARADQTPGRQLAGSASCVARGRPVLSRTTRRTPVRIASTSVRPELICLKSSCAAC